MESQDIRWKQRFQNFKQAFFRLQEAADQVNLNELERNGLIQRFEFPVELAWKVMNFRTIMTASFLIFRKPRQGITSSRQRYRHCDYR
ncbi:MAG: nucleotidyltransferase substrate binding protein [Dysgonamonadaceae bacterium]|nr:nucleotidyltransferase substrate binding protein [Dysgonamonadaceae bacterium]